jgi:hypothetical protein
MLWPVPTPRRPGDPGRAPPVAAALVALTLAHSASAAPATTGTATPAPTQPAATPTSAPASTTTAPSTSTAPKSATPPPAGTAAPNSASAPTAGTAAPTSATGTTPSSSASTTAPADTATAPSTATETSAATSPGDPAAAPGTATPSAEPDTTTPARASARVPARKPPRVDGPYIGGTIAAGGSFARVNNFPTPDPLSGGTMSLRFGQAIYPWMTIGLEVTGTWANRFADPRQRLLQGAVLVDFGFLPVPRIPLSLHVGFGAGGGAVRQADRTARSGFGGAVFTGAVRYEIFPLAARKRPTRGGGFSLGPELGWLGFTPAAKGRPMTNTVYIGLFMGFYFGS